MKKEERENRIVARGEISDHCHCVIGDAKVTHNGDQTVVEVFGKASIKHILESNWVNEGTEVWTKEHTDIELSPGKYEYVPQIEYDPYEDEIRKVRD
jgi:hypothetical protein